MTRPRDNTQSALWHVITTYGEKRVACKIHRRNGCRVSHVTLLSGTNLLWLHSLHCEKEKASFALTHTALALCFTLNWKVSVEWSVKAWNLNKQTTHLYMYPSCTVSYQLTHMVYHYIHFFLWEYLQSENGIYLIVVARVVTALATILELCNLEGEREVGVGAAPGAWVTPLYHCGVDLSNLHLVRFHCLRRKQNTRVRPKQWKATKEEASSKEFSPISDK